MNDICDHCGKPIKHPVYLQQGTHILKFGRKCAKHVQKFESWQPLNEKRTTKGCLGLLKERYFRINHGSP